MEIHGSGRLSLRLRVSGRFPCVRMGVSFTAMKVSLLGECRRLAGDSRADEAATSTQQRQQRRAGLLW